MTDVIRHDMQTQAYYSSGAQPLSEEEKAARTQEHSFWRRLRKLRDSRAICPAMDAYMEGNGATRQWEVRDGIVKGEMGKQSYQGTNAPCYSCQQSAMSILFGGKATVAVNPPGDDTRQYEVDCAALYEEAEGSALVLGRNDGKKRHQLAIVKRDTPAKVSDGGTCLDPPQVNTQTHEGYLTWMQCLMRGEPCTPKKTE